MSTNQLIDFSNSISVDQSIYDYCVITEKCKEYLWASKNYSSIPYYTGVSHYTSVFFDKEIIKIVEEIGPEKIAMIISDNATNTCVV
ncbi:21664_t:CDS:1 [Racocetra persica]|uniref:21664_t:CDS:1 n=1 Tax=Racocetra persica TaxID=160502 RepID=A0ACA9Q6C2_9GLOM|nr:21664_t:CDS:1 [Racocetra persica]